MNGDIREAQGSPNAKSPVFKQLEHLKKVSANLEARVNALAMRLQPIMLSRLVPASATDQESPKERSLIGNDIQDIIKMLESVDTHLMTISEAIEI